MYFPRKCKVWLLGCISFVIVAVNAAYYYYMFVLCNPKLHFIHIPKTGGTAITYNAATHSILWGINFWSFCGDDGELDPEIHARMAHVPPRYHTHSASGGRYGDDTPTFCVVRDPYERLYSEMSYRATAKTWRWSNWAGQEYSADGKTCDIKIANTFIYHILHQDLWSRHYMNLAHWHMTPQSYYVHDADNRVTCDNILRYSNLSSEFNELMRSHDLPVRLPPKYEELTEKDQGSSLVRRAIERYVNQLTEEEMMIETNNAIDSINKDEEEEEGDKGGTWDTQNYGHHVCNFTFPQDLDVKTVRVFNQIYARDFIEFNFSPLCAATKKRGENIRSKDPLECDEIRGAIGDPSNERHDDADFVESKYYKW